ncbi:hypothetical protein MNEG_15706, partial [Monoraphidium neglectum]
ELERRHTGCAVLLVSHGDTLSITQAAAGGGPLGTHRVFGLGTAELKRLEGSTSSTSSSGGGGAASAAGAVAAPGAGPV